MSEATIPLVDPKSLLTLFGTRDQHLRKIRDSLGVSVSGRNDRIHIEGQDEAVAHATEVFEQLKDLASRYGVVSPEEVSQVLSTVTGKSMDVEHSPIELQFAGRPIRPRTAGQARYVSAIHEHDLTFCIGPAGTGKTYLAVAMAVQALKQETIRKIVLVRPAVEAGESLGFLPGDLQAKINPYLRPLLDALREMMDYDQIKRYTEQDLIEMIPLAYMRGRTLNEAFVILDEAQNTTVAQMKMFLTRMGLGTKMVVSGDTTQVDLPSHTRSGLLDAVHRLQGIEGFCQVTLNNKDIVRHRLVQEIVRVYEEEEPKKAALNAPANHVKRKSKTDPMGPGGVPAALAPGLLERNWQYLKRGDVLARIGLCVVAVMGLWIVTKAWSIPLGYERNYTPARDIIANVKFDKADPERTREAKELAKRTVSYVYKQDKEPLVQLRAALQNRIVIVAGAKSLAELDKKSWLEFFPPPGSGAGTLTSDDEDRRFQVFHDALSTPESLSKLEQAVANALAPSEQHGLLAKLPQEPNEGNQQEIVVVSKTDPDEIQNVKVSDVLIGEADWLKKALAERFDSPEVADRVFTWLRGRLPSTLAFDPDLTQVAKDGAVAAVEDKFVTISPGEVLVRGGVPLSDDHIALLTLEHDAFLRQLSLGRRLAHSLAALGMFVALSVLCGVYVINYEPRLLDNLRRFSTFLALIVITVGLSVLASGDNVRAELVPLIVFGMTLSIAYHRELALLFSAAAALIVVVSTGRGLSDFMILNAAVASAILLVGNVRNRRKLIYVGLAVGAVTLLTTIGVDTLRAQPWATIWPEALRYGLWSVFAGLLMLGLLPFIESLFGVQTELSLLELGDVAHPLLQELVRRAPGTYNHSINVASIAEAAAESIGAKGLLVRVGAYFHDIGKMLKPGYFVENQGNDANRHASLVPAMSTLIIIASIKDGADLARQHRLPEPIIDFIEQHHGTTLVEYFYRRASERNEANPDGAEIDESDFRYPGPKPQTKEAAVLMLADAVESASRALVEPTPARIESLIQDISMKRLLDGQFDACSLTLKELATINESLVKSLTAVYHGRVKYPDQRTA